MLGRLLKYDLKWIYKVVVVFYILAIVFALIGRGLSSIENSVIFNIFGQVCIGFAIGMMVSILINNIMRVWARFIRNIYKDESYLTHTLPIEKKTVYLSKILSAVMTMLTSTVVILIALAICYYSEANIEYLKTMLESVAAIYDSTVISFVLIMFALVCFQMIFTLLAGYVGIIIAHRSNNGRMVKSIIYGFISYMIAQGVTLLILFAIGLFNPSIMNLFSTTDIVDIGSIKAIMYAGIGTYAVYILVYYMIGKKQFEKGVNVE